MPEMLEKAKELVPSSYYDLIARVVPGSVAIVAVYWLFTERPVPLGSISATALVLLVGAGYVVGVWLSTLSTLLLLPLLVIPKLSRYSDRAVWEGIRRRAPDTDGSTVVKMAAESTAAENLFLLAILLNLAALQFAPSKLSMLVPLVPVTLLIAVIRRYMLRIRIDEPVGTPLTADGGQRVATSGILLTDGALLKFKSELAKSTESNLTVAQLRDALSSALADEQSTRSAAIQVRRGETA